MVKLIDDDEDEEDDEELFLSSPHPTNAVAVIARAETNANVFLSVFIGFFLLKYVLYFSNFKV